MANHPNASDLNLYWRFDTPGGIAENHYWIEADLSPSGMNDGLVGDMPTIRNVMEYVTDRGIVVPDAPEYMPSVAPVVGGGAMVFACACSSGSGSAATIALPAEDPDGDALTVTVTSLPEFGTLATSAGTALAVGDTVTESSVVYTPFTTFTFHDSFNYTASDGTALATAAVLIIDTGFAVVDNRTVTIDEDRLEPIILGRSSNTNEYLEVVITALPSKGTLYQAAFADGFTSAYDTLVSDSSDTSLVAITSTGTTLTNARGIVLYAPDANEFGSDYAEFSYKYVDATSAQESDEATVFLDILSVNDAPASNDVAVEIADGDTVIVVSLTGSDVDNDRSTPDAYDPMFAPHFFATVNSFPTLGALYQVEADGSRGAEISVEGQPTVTSYASKVLRYSSQYSVCSTDCYSWASDLCTAANTGAVDSTALPDIVDQVWGDGTCALTEWSAYAFLGAPDFYPEYGDSTLGWDKSSENYGHEWVEIMFDTPLYIDSIEIYEIHKPGAVYKVSSARTYDDDNTVPCYESGVPPPTKGSRKRLARTTRSGPRFICASPRRRPR